jgi:hypothetical protein
VVTFAMAAFPIALYHPDESTYYNFFVGGLGGAQESKLTESYCKGMEWWCPDSEGDYWAFSYRRALEELGRRAEPKATFTACGILLHPLTKFQHVREGLQLVPGNRPDWAEWYVVIPRRPFCDENWMRFIHEWADLVTEERRDGGLIWAIYRRR